MFFQILSCSTLLQFEGVSVQLHAPVAGAATSHILSTMSFKGWGRKRRGQRHDVVDLYSRKRVITSKATHS